MAQTKIRSQEARVLSRLDKRLIAGWLAVGLSTAIACFWAFWGAIETFHEGWYYDSILSNVSLMLIQYLSPMLIFMGITLFSIALPRFGAVLHVLFALFAAWFFRASAPTVMFMIILPLGGLGFLYWFGRPKPRKIAFYLASGLPVLTLILFGMEPALRVSQRLDDGNLQARPVQGNGIVLIWAPDGPGWPRAGANWYAAQTACAHLDSDGQSSTSGPQDIWRLPTADEAVRSMTRQGRNSGGVWDASSGAATYDTTPDKESPLWNIHSQVIYWWTATEVDEDEAFIIAYDGKVWRRSKSFSPASLGFRCVKP